MKAMFTVFMLFICILPKMALSQDSRYLGVEMLGNGAFYSVSYFHDFSNERPKSFWGFRAGLGLMPLPTSDGMGEERMTIDIYVPLSVHYTILEHLEFGMGVTLNTDSRTEFENNESRWITELHTLIVPSIGYRKYMGEKWLFRATFTPIYFTDPDDGRLLPWLGLTFAKRLN